LHKQFVGDFGKSWYRHCAITEDSASKIEQQHLNIKNKNKRLYGQSLLTICEDSDTSSDEGKLLINFFYNSLLILFLIIGINIIQQKKK